MRRPKSRVQCLDRSLDILEALARRGPLGIAELSREVGLHVATAYNLVRAFALRSYIVSAQGAYRLGPALAALTQAGDPVLSLPGLAQPCLERITGATGESAVVGILAGMRLVLIATTASADGLSCPAPQQAFPCALAMATGRVLVAHRPAGEWPAFEDACRRQTGALAPGEPEGAAGWRRLFRQIVDGDLCVVRRGGASGSVAAPIRDAAGAVVAALGANSVARFGDPGHRRRLTDAVRAAAREMSAALGARPAVAPTAEGTAPAAPDR